ncbi:hypothetical protein [Spirosoma fluminis]
MRSQASTTFDAPYFSAPNEAAVLSRADTVAISRHGFSNHYIYRGIRVYPAWQLTQLADRLHDNDVKDGFQYARQVSSIAGLIGSFGASCLTSSLLVYGIRRTNGNSATLNTPLFWGSLAALTFTYGIRLHVGRVQLRTIELVNKRIRDRYSPAATGEHFVQP